MPIPKYDEMYRAFLNCLADGQLHRSKEVKDTVAGAFSISEKERAELLPSGKQQLFDNRIGMAIMFACSKQKTIELSKSIWTKLKRSCIMESTDKGF